LTTSAETKVEATATAHWSDSGQPAPAPVINAEANCDAGGLDVTVDNRGDADFTFTHQNQSHTIAAGRKKTVLLPLTEDQPYKVEIPMPDGSVKTFEGVLDCEPTEDAPTPSQEPTTPNPGPEQEPASEGHLAATGAGALARLIGGGLALTALGAILYCLRKRLPGQR
ncbi:peptidase, partial [Streptomyces formicae]